MALDPYESIQSEIAHLKKSSLAPSFGHRALSALQFLGIVLFLGIVGLYFMDPFAYAIEKRRAFRIYSYLKNFGTSDSLQNLVSTNIFTPEEIHILDVNTDDSRRFFGTTLEAEEASREVISYMIDLEAMKTGNLAKASWLAHLRYNLFGHFGISTPQPWRWLNPHPVRSSHWFN